jgi:hypothetical protein
MQILNRIYNIFKSVSLLAVVLVLVFTVPMSAHTNMIDNGSSNHAHEMSAMDMTSHDETNSTHEHDGVGCCETGMCISAVLLENYNFSKADQVYTHIALPIGKMTSAGKSRLMRPPSL